MAWVPQARAELPADEEVTYSGGYPATGLSPAPTTDHAVGAYDPRAHETATDGTGSYETAGGEPAGDAAQDQPAEQATLTRPEPAVLPQFLRKRSSPTPPEG